MPSENRQPASFRDPSGFLFRRGGVLYRQVNQCYRQEYDQLMASGLYENLVKRGWLVTHEEVILDEATDDQAYKIIQPASLEFISYPYEWSFSQLKDAALLTLRIQKRALRHGMSLKDSSAYNIQFDLESGKPTLIDSLSFEICEEGQPWVAYRQFCQHFLAPLTLMAYTDIRLSQFLRIYIDGLPLDLASSLLPGKTRLNFGLLTHLHLHASAQKRYAGQAVDTAESGRQMSKTSLLGLIDSLGNTVKKLTWQPADTDWGDYYEDTNYSETAMAQKDTLVADFVGRVAPELVWDLGANTGRFSRIASREGIPTIAFDIDPAAVEKNYLQIKAQKETHLLPLIIDLTNPSAGMGWANQERGSLTARANADLVLALALVHHLAISNNVPLEMIADYFGQLAPWLVIEFVPKSDSQVQRLLISREDIFETYTQDGFEQAFGTRYHIRAAEAIQGSERRLYLMERK